MTSARLFPFLIGFTRLESAALAKKDRVEAVMAGGLLETPETAKST